MAHTYTYSGGSGSTSGSMTDIVQTAYNEYIRLQFKPRPIFDSLAQAQGVNVGRAPRRGDVASFTIFEALPAATTALTETSDIDAVGMSETQKTISVSEYGRSVITTLPLEALSYIDVDRAKAAVVAQNMKQSLDLIARAAFDAEVGSSYITYGNNRTAINTIASGDTLSATLVRQTFTTLRSANVPFYEGPEGGNAYVAVCHPHSLHDLKTETGSGSWRNALEYKDSLDNGLFTGEVGMFEGFRFIDSTNAQLQADQSAGTSVSTAVGNTYDIYTNYFVGADAVGKAVGVDAHLVVGPITDTLKRFFPLGWYALIGYGAVRPESLHKVYTVSSVGANS
ncbi:MAG: N4-gp56 family major capsid protein [Actinobacteria bacterium]|nr:N4-gp56 family major capsid protein [Actinomycetota bacterium]